MKIKLIANQNAEKDKSIIQEYGTLESTFEVDDDCEEVYIFITPQINVTNKSSCRLKFNFYEIKE